MIETCYVLCVVSDDSDLVKRELEKLSKNCSLNHYSHLYCYTSEPNLINFNDFCNLPEVSISQSNNNKSLDSILLWSDSCPVDLMILSDNNNFSKEVRDRYGYKRHNINVIESRTNFDFVNGYKVRKVSEVKI